jgi:hypothetical protein
VGKEEHRGALPARHGRGRHDQDLPRLETRVPHSVRILKLSIALACALFLVGCGTLRLAYNNVDELVYWWLHGYVEIERTQAPRVRQDIAALHAWHRTRELPRIEAFLQALEKLAPGEVTAAQACALVPLVRGFVKAVADQAEPAMAALATSLDAEQLRHLEQKYSRNNAKFRKDWVQLSARELLDKRFDTVLERTERVYGRLDSAQRTVLRQQLQNTVYSPERTLAERQARQQDTLRLLRGLAEQRGGTAPAREQVHAALQRVFTASQTGYAEQLAQENCRAMAAVHNSTTPAQREVAVERLRGWQRDLRELTAQP